MLLGKFGDTIRGKCVLLFHKPHLFKTASVSYSGIEFESYYGNAIETEVGGVAVHVAMCKLR